MPTTISSQEFVNKWRQVSANEKKMAQSHFNDLCRLIGHITPLEADPKGEWFTFETFPFPFPPCKEPKRDAWLNASPTPNPPPSQQ